MAWTTMTFTSPQDVASFLNLASVPPASAAFAKVTSGPDASTAGQTDYYVIIQLPANWPCNVPDSSECHNLR